MPGVHILSRYDEELSRLNNTIIQMGGLAENQIRRAFLAIARFDADLAEAVVADDALVDGLQQQVDAQVNLLLALQQPVASDLRDIISALKIAGNLERVCDYAANIAKRAHAIDHGMRSRSVHVLSRMEEIARNQIRDVIDAYVGRDADKAVAVWNADEALDDIYTSLFRELLTYMMEDPRAITPGTHLLFIAKNIERIGDHITNIAEGVYFLAKGARLKSGRPKRDQTAATVVMPR